MTNEQKQHISRSLADEKQELQQLEAGQWPKWAKWPGRHLPEKISLDERRRYADWCLRAVLYSILPTLPGDLQTEVQACYDLREHIWSEAYRKAYYAAQQQQQASPECLQASDSLSS